MPSWIILTGEYPPRLGGVADYTRKLAVEFAGLAEKLREPGERRFCMRP